MKDAAVYSLIRRGGAAWLRRPLVSVGAALVALVLVAAPAALAAAAPSPQVAAEATEPAHVGGEANLVLPDLGAVDFMGVNGRTLLMVGLLVCVGGLLFGLVIYRQLRALPVHASMRDISELIYETCKAYMLQQGRFLLILEAFIGVIIVVYFGFLQNFEWSRVGIILAFSVIGIAGSYGVAWFGIRLNTLANSRTAFASLRGKAFPIYLIPLKSGMSIGMALISVELFMMLSILLFIPREYAGPCFIGFAIGESLGAAALRIAGGIFTKIADIGSDLMKIVFNIKEDDARNPGVIADCTGDNAGDSVGPTADGFETYGVTGVALITFIVLAVPDATVQVQLLVWIFVMRIMMIVASGLSYLVNNTFARARYGNAERMNFEAPLTSLVWITSIVSVIITYIVSFLLIPDLAGDGSLWWKLSTVITCGTLAGAIIPELVKIFTSTESAHVKEVVRSGREGGASLDILSGLVAGNFSAYWLGLAIMLLMAIGYVVSTTFPGGLMMAPAVFAFGLVAFGFLGMGPVTIAVDSYGPVTDNAQSVFELSVIEQIPGIKQELRRDHGIDADFGAAKDLLETGDGAGNTFKATAKPVLIGTAVVGATTMIFSIIVMLTDGLRPELVANMSLVHAPFLLGLIAGGAVIYWFTGASMQAVTTGAYRAVEFIKRNIRLEGVEKASVSDSKRVVEICTQYAQKGMFNIFLTVFFSTLAFAFLEPFFFVGYLISIALFGLFQAIFMANAGGAWDNAKKIVEVELKEKGTPLHAATVVGDTVGDPFKDTSSVAMNPVIKFTTLFGLLAVELAVQLTREAGQGLSWVLSAAFFAVAVFFVIRSFYGMRIPASPEEGA
ncbi:MAG: sodium-translocating pyrophosphatase [Acidobacteria bacterium]|nr:sodium-translocating pyrophosphatase [Acidobacteriota bacterium]